MFPTDQVDLDLLKICFLKGYKQIEIGYAHITLYRSMKLMFLKIAIQNNNISNNHRLSRKRRSQPFGTIRLKQTCHIPFLRFRAGSMTLNLRTLYFFSPDQGGSDSSIQCGNTRWQHPGNAMVNSIHIPV